MEDRLFDPERPVDISRGPRYEEPPSLPVHRLGDLDHLLFRLARGEDHFRHPLSQMPVVVYLRK